MSPPAIADPTNDHTATMLFFHGRGGSGAGWNKHLQKKLGLDYMRYVCPHAGVRAISLTGMPATAWFDVHSMDLSLHDERSIKAARDKVHKWIEREIAEFAIPSERIVLCGFSQGGSLALYSGLTYPKRLGAIVAISCFVALPSLLPKEIEQCNRDIPIFQGHGDKDYVVDPIVAQASVQLMKSITPNIEFKMYAEAQHDDTDEEMTDIKEFLSRHVPAI